MKALYKNPIAIVFLVLTITGFVYFEEQFNPIDLSNLEMGNIISILGYLSVIMLVVEQVIEIFVYDPNEKVKIQCKKRIEEINKYLENIDNPEDSMVVDLETLPADIRQEKVVKAMKEKKELEEFLITRGQKRQRITMIIAFIMGLILSFSGLRLMSGIMLNNPEQQLSEIQTTIIQSIDIILTAGIIAGGSGRMHRLIKRIKEATGSSEI